MNIVSAPFLFLFLPVTVAAYYLIPADNGLRRRNLLLTLASLLFYTWGEPFFVLLVVLMLCLTRHLGRIACEGKGSARGRLAVALTVLVNMALMISFVKVDSVLSALGQLLGLDLSNLKTSLPLGFSFFIFSSVSYVVDLYRGSCAAPGTFLDTALYIGAFFRILQGPIVSSHAFEPQLSARPQSLDLLGNGVRRIALGLVKKILIADNLSLIVSRILTADLASLPAGDAWLGCIAYMVYLYYDFSGYSDMAIGLAQLFGFSIPENFNYPYFAKSVSDFWRRFHITLCAWFTEYLYFPILLGPSIRLRKLLQRKNVPSGLAKALQDILVTASVWAATALWHGLSPSYAIWGAVNCAAILLEPYRKPLKNRRLDSLLSHACLLLFLCLSMPLISIPTLDDALLYYRAMLTGGHDFTESVLLWRSYYGVWFFIAVLGCFPIVPYLKRKCEKHPLLWELLTSVLLAALVLISLVFVFTKESKLFLYQ